MNQIPLASGSDKPKSIKWTKFTISILNEWYKSLQPKLVSHVSSVKVQHTLKKQCVFVFKCTMNKIKINLNFFDRCRLNYHRNWGKTSLCWRSSNVVSSHKWAICRHSNSVLTALGRCLWLLCPQMENKTRS